MQVTKGTWRMREQCVPGSLSSSPAQEPGNEASNGLAFIHICDRLAAKFTPLEVEKIVDKKNKTKRFLIAACVF